jgi:hypothetical protein
LIVNRLGLVWKSGSYFVPNPKGFLRSLGARSRATLMAGVARAD